jgi:hypothetical protein
MVLQSLMEGLWRSSHALVSCVTWHGLSAGGATGAMSATRFCVGMLPFRLRPASNGQLRVNGGIVKTVKVLRNVVGSAGLLFMGYVVLTSLPDLRRYIRISTM